MYLNQHTGRRVRIAVIDSGVHTAHPHVGGISGGVGIRDDGTLTDDFVDRLGHGTAVAAAIHEKAPDAEILAIKVFWNALATDVRVLVRAIDEACARGARVINLSLGTSIADHRAPLEAAVARAARRGTFIVSAMEDETIEWLPGAIDGMIAVQLTWTCGRNAYHVVRADRRLVVAASGYPRDIPGVPRERNLKGASFAVANATGFIARALESLPSASLRDVAARLVWGESAAFFTISAT